MYTPFAYAITKTPYALFAKITLCMYLLYGTIFRCKTAQAKGENFENFQSLCKIER